MAKAPSARKFTLSEKRSLTFERVTLYMVLLVALIAACISFIALRSVGRDAGLGEASFLLPIAIDGFGIACSVGIVRSVASGEKFRGRVSEWLGLMSALSLSILGNVQHALKVGAPLLPDYVKIAYATAIPVIVAYGIHVYGRAMAKGISAHVLVDDPDTIHFGLAHLGDESAQQGRAQQPRARAQTHTETRNAQPLARNVLAQESAQPRAQVTPEPARTSAPPMRTADAQQRARELFERALAESPGAKPDAAAIHRELGFGHNPATTRRWVSGWWEQEQATAEPERDPILEQLRPDERGAGERRESA